jgi:hypothetical protein
MSETFPHLKRLRCWRRMPAFVLAAIAVSTAASRAAPPAASVDLARIPRTISKEPAYRTPEQRYCLLVLGPKALSRVWLVLDGGDLYVDRNRNGVLTETGERVAGVEGRFKVGDLVEADGKSRYRNVIVGVNQRHGTEEEGVVVKPFELTANVRGLFEMGAEPAFAAKPAEAPIVHFGGPLSMRVFDPLIVQRGQRIAFRCLIRTPGLGEGAEAGLYHYGLPEEVMPVVSIELPGVSEALRVDLRTRCCQRLFLGSTRIPPTAGMGEAKVSLSFLEWKEGGVQVSSDTIQVR